MGAKVTICREHKDTTVVYIWQDECPLCHSQSDDLERKLSDAEEEIEELEATNKMLLDRVQELVPQGAII